MSALADGELGSRKRDGWRDLLPAAPLHPIFVHFTIAPTAASLLFDFLSRVRQDQSLAHAGWWTIAFAGGMTILTIVTGLISRANVEMGEGRARSYLRAHMALGFVFFGVLIPTAVWRSALWNAERIPDWSYLSVLALLNLIMLAQGYLGGELVYRWGADVEGAHARLSQEQAGSAPPEPRA
jgi:uncharacterized membrane protein